MILSEYIMELRIGRGLTQQELADEIGVSRQAVAKWESGTSTPDLNNMLSLCNLFGLSPNQLLGYEEKSESGVKTESNTKIDAGDIVKTDTEAEEHAASKKISKLHGVIKGILSNKKKRLICIVVILAIILCTVTAIFILDLGSNEYIHKYFTSDRNDMPNWLSDRTLDDEQLEMLASESMSGVAENINTFGDCIAFFDVLCDENYSTLIFRLDGDVYPIICDEMFDVAKSNNAIGFNMFSAISAYLLQDNYEDSGYLVAFSEDIENDQYFVANYFFYEGQYHIVTFDNTLSYNIGGIAAKIFRYDVVDNLEDYIDICDFKLDYTRIDIDMMLKVDNSEDIKWRYVNDEFSLDGGEIIATSDRGFYSETDSPQEQPSTDLTMQETLDKAQEEVATIDELFQYLKNSGNKFSLVGDLNQLENGRLWQFNRSALQVLIDGESNCGSSSNIARYLLDGDYEEVGSIGLTYKIGAGGGHVISYVYDGTWYYVFDVNAWGSSNYSSNSKKILKISSLDKLPGRLDEVLLGDVSVVRTIISSTDMNDVPIVFDLPKSLYPMQADVNIIKETPEEGYVVELVDFPNFEEVLNREVAAG